MTQACEISRSSCEPGGGPGSPCTLERSPPCARGPGPAPRSARLRGQGGVTTSAIFLSPVGAFSHFVPQIVFFLGGAVGSHSLTEVFGGKSLLRTVYSLVKMMISMGHISF